MKIINFIIILFSLSCSQMVTKPTREVASSAMPARIVNFVDSIPLQVEYSKNLQFEIKIQAFRFGTLVANNRQAIFEVMQGEAKFEKPEVSTDEKGFANSKLIIEGHSKPVKIKIRVDNVIKYHEFQIIRPLNFIGDFSYNKSTLSIDQNRFDADGKSKITFKLQINDEQGKMVDAYGLKIALVNSLNDEFLFKEEGYGLYSVQVTTSTKAGVNSFHALYEGKKVGESIKITYLPVLRFNPSDFVVTTISSKQIRVMFPLKDLAGDFIEPAFTGDIIAQKQGDGEVSKVKFNHVESHYYFDFTPPAKDGSTKVGVAVKGQIYWVSRPINYEYNPVVLDKISFDVEKLRIIPSGYDSLKVTVIYKDENNQPIRITNQAQFPTFEFDQGQAKIVDLKQVSDGVFEGRLVPAFMTKNLKVLVHYENKLIAEKMLKFNFEPITDKISNQRHTGSGLYGNDINYKLNDLNGWGVNATGKLVGFELTNKGINDIIPRGCSSDSDDNNCQGSREFAFEFDEQARQNMAMIVTDFPSDSLSKMMHAWFYFFPRKVIPHAYYSEDKAKIIVVLPTNEEVIFDAKAKKIIGGVLEEGPIDLGPSRHSRKFPLIRYKGSGVVLRINARGQDARIGQFNNNRIAGDYGDTGARDVMIYRYNSATNRPDICYAAKADFWPQKDINPIPFKYFADQDFNAFLKSKCSFDLKLD
jgi:hypothetical protein